MLCCPKELDIPTCYVCTLTHILKEDLVPECLKFSEITGKIPLINILDWDNNPILSHVRSLDMMKVLLSHYNSLDINDLCDDDDRETLLHMMIRFEYIPGLVSLLVDLGANLEIEDSRSYDTPLEKALWYATCEPEIKRYETNYIAEKYALDLIKAGAKITHGAKKTVKECVYISDTLKNAIHRVNS